MIIKLWKNFSKRSNSTKRPTATAVELNVTLKQPTSIESPSFILSGDEYDFNYCYAFGHYYFITDITSISDGRYKIDCKQDVLATWKNNIINSIQYVMYAAENYDPYVLDNRCMMKPSYTFTGSAAYSSTGSTIFFDNASAGCYVLTVLNTVAGSGATTSYKLTEAQLNSIIENLVGQSSWTQVLVQSPIDYIVKCSWLPVVAGAFAVGETQNVRIGQHDTGIFAPIVPTGNTVLPEVNLNWTWPVNDFRRLNPYSTMRLYIPFYGYVELDTHIFYKENTVHIKGNFDAITGDVTFKIYAEDDMNSQIITYNIAVDVPIAQIKQNVIGTIGGATTAAGGAAAVLASTSAGGAVAGVAAMLAGTVNAMMSYNTPAGDVKGHMEGRTRNLMSTENKFVLDVLTHEVTADPDDYALIQGRPVMDYAGLSTFSGFIQCADASIDIPGFSGDRDEVNSYLNSGLYLE